MSDRELAERLEEQECPLHGKSCPDSKDSLDEGDNQSQN